jgi:hypothetical protein
VAKMEWRLRGGKSAFILHSGNSAHNFHVSMSRYIYIYIYIYIYVISVQNATMESQRRE